MGVCIHIVCKRGEREGIGRLRQTPSPANYLYWSILKKSRHLGLGVFMVHARIGLKLGCVEVRYLVDVCAAVPDKVEDGGEAASLEYCPRLTGAHQLQHLDALLCQIAARPTDNQSLHTSVDQ
jgi:hypothetical protein